MSTEILSRIQFAFTISFHYIYPPLSIGVGLVLVIMEGLYLKTGLKVYADMTRFWIKIFALIFGLGVATGIIMEFEFGTNWAVYSRYVGDVFGSTLAAEGIFAFAVESGFLGVLLFGWKRVSNRVHFLSTIMVFLGSLFSAVWIVVANSWQQTPAGFHIVGQGLQARAEITDFWAMVFNPSSVQRLMHVWIGAFLAGAFLVMSVNAYYIRKKKYLPIARPAFKIGLAVATFFSLAQLVAGDKSAEGVARNQPAKLAAMEGHFDSSAPAPLYLLGWVNKEKGKTTGIAIPGGLSWLVYQDAAKPIKGLNAFPELDRPGQVNAVFQFYHIMIAMGVLMILLTLYACWQWRKGRLFDKDWLMKVFVWAVLLPQIANQVGWFTAEMGRQPWVVYGLLRTPDALSREVKSEQILVSLILFTLVYCMLFVLFLYMMNRKIKHGPEYQMTAEEEAQNHFSFREHAMVEHKTN